MSTLRAARASARQSEVCESADRIATTAARCGSSRPGPHVAAQLERERLLEHEGGLAVVVLVVDELLEERVADQPLVGILRVGGQRRGLEERAILVGVLRALELLGPALLVGARALLGLLLVVPVLIGVGEEAGERHVADQRLREDRQRAVRRFRW